MPTAATYTLPNGETVTSTSPRRFLVVACREATADHPAHARIRTRTDDASRARRLVGNWGVRPAARISDGTLVGREYLTVIDQAEATR